MDTLTVQERKALEQALQQHNDEDAYCAKIQIVVDPKKKKNEDRTFLIGKHRIYLFRQGGKLSNEAHLLDILEVSSPTATSLTIKTKQFVVSLPEPSSEEQINEILVKLYVSFLTSFPGKQKTYPFAVTPEDRLEKIKKAAEAEDTEKSESFCGGFVNSYQSICDQLNIPICQDISWDINNLYVLNDVTDFNLFELSMRQDKLISSDYRALLQALQFNSWFTTLVVPPMMKIEKDVWGYIASTFQHNSALDTLILKDCGLSRDALSSLCSAFQANPNLALTSIDISGNEVEDRGLQALATVFSSSFKTKGLTHLDISRCGGSAKSLVALVNSMASNEKICQTLTYLNLNGNRLDGDGSKALSQFFAKCNSIVELSLAGSNPDFHLLKKSDVLTTLDVSGTRIITKDSKHLDMFRFLQLSTSLRKLNLSRCQFPAETFPQLLEAIPHVESLDLSDNSLNDSGLIALVDALTNTKNNVKHLTLNGNFDKPSKLRGKAFQKLSILFGSESCIIESFSITGNSKSQLQAALMPFIFSLMTNKSLKLLDVSGNQIGNQLALALGKALQTNKTLETLIWDENGITLQGYQMFKNGLARNTSLKYMPIPTSDISAGIKDFDSLPALIREIQQMIYNNSMSSRVVTHQPTSQPTKQSHPPASNTRESFVREGGNAPPSTRETRESFIREGGPPVAAGGPPRKPPPSAPGGAPPVKPQPPIPGGAPGAINNNNNNSNSNNNNGQAPPVKKAHPMRVKPTGIDTQHVSALFGQLNDLMVSAAEELTPEELEEMKAQFKQQQ